jgi:hypothetical protein
VLQQTTVNFDGAVRDCAIAVTAVHEIGGIAVLEWRP